MFAREPKRTETSAFFPGPPRETGKPTWIRENYKDGFPVYDLLNTTELIRLSRAPSLLYRETAHLPPGSWIVIDEIQKIPALLKEMHRAPLAAVTLGEPDLAGFHATFANLEQTPDREGGQTQ
jgi:hypothetical protein